jgi:hypothetical protein
MLNCILKELNVRFWGGFILTQTLLPQNQRLSLVFAKQEENQLGGYACLMFYVNEVYF